MNYILTQVSQIPIVIDNIFLSDEECVEIKDKVISLKDYWQSHKNINHLKFLPMGMYMYTCNKEQYTVNVLDYRSLMLDNFKEVYLKLVNKLSDVLCTEIILDPILNLPGFHIGVSNSPTMPNFHCDGFNWLYTLISYNQMKAQNKNFFVEPKILSIIIPISLPVNGSGLLYYNGRILKELNYDIGMLATWPGNMVHAIKPFEVNDDYEMRITMQCHLLQFSNRAYLFW